MWNVDRIVWSNLTAHISVVRLSLEALAFSVIWSSLSMNVGSQFTNLILTIAFLEWLNANKLKVSYVGPKWIFFLSFSTPTSRRIKNCSIRTNYARSLSLSIYIPLIVKVNILHVIIYSYKSPLFCWSLGLVDMVVQYVFNKCIFEDSQPTIHHLNIGVNLT